MCPLVDELALYDVVNTPGVSADLSHISSIAVSTSDEMEHLDKLRISQENKRLPSKRGRIEACAYRSGCGVDSCWDSSYVFHEF